MKGMKMRRWLKHVFKGEIMGGTHDGEKLILFKKPLQSNPAFEIPINKSEGQPMKFVGIDLQSWPAFSHGQLYVSLSRVTKQAKLYVIGPDSYE
jgi:hypothetical protein